MIGCLPYLLRTTQEIESFRTRNARLLEFHRHRYRAWFNSLPLFRWVPLPLDSPEIGLIVGILCILYVDGEINLTVSRDGGAVMRGVMSDEEYNEYINANFKSYKSVTGKHCDAEKG